MNSRRVVHLVDDEEAIRKSAGFLLRAAGYEVVAYESGPHFLEAVIDARPGVVLLDVRMPEIGGLEVQRLMNEGGIALPVIALTGHGDVPIAVQAMKQGAIDFLEKPFEKAQLLRSLDVAFDELAKRRSLVDAAKDAVTRLAALTPREREVLNGLVRGLPNKAIAYDLGISPRTVEVHRANLMFKLDARSLPEVLRLVFVAGEVPLSGELRISKATQRQ